MRMISYFIRSNYKSNLQFKELNINFFIPESVGLNKLTTQTESQILVVSQCMLSLFRPSFEVVKEGRISLLEIKTIFEDIIIWQAQKDPDSWTTKTRLI
jgi:hypothetical protein